jgi:hypothetical protein
MSLLNTRVQDLRIASPNLDKWTNRPSRYGAFNVFKTGNDEADAICSPDLIARAKTAVGRQVQVPVYDSEDVTIGNTRSITIADSENTSQLYTVNFTTLAWGFTVVPSHFQSNEHGAQADFQRKYLKYLYKVASTLDSACLSSLSINKSQVFADLIGYANTGNTIIATDAQKDEIIGDLTPIMNANDYYGDYHVVANTGLQSRIMKMSEHSIFNDQDKTIQFMDKNFHFTNRLDNAAGQNATGYIVNSASCGLLFRHEREAILGTTLPDGTAWRIDTLPMLGIPCDTYFYYGRSDESARAGAETADMTRVAKEHHGFSVEFATITAYQNDMPNNATPIIKFAIADA